MKKIFAALFLTGILACCIPGVQAKENFVGPSHPSNVKVVKGMALDFNFDGSWDCVSFGLLGNRFSVSAVEILDTQQNSIATVDLSSTFPQHGFAWYFVDLKEYKVPQNFLLKIHLSDRNFSGLTDSAVSTLRLMAEGDGTNDPEETVIIVKYP